MTHAARPADTSVDDEDYQKFQEMQDQRPVCTGLCHQSKINSAITGLDSLGFCPVPLYHILFHLAGITWTFSGRILDSFWCHSTWQSSQQNAHSETACDSQRQQIQNGADGPPHWCRWRQIGSTAGCGTAEPFRDDSEAQKAKLHHGAGEGIPIEEDWPSWLFEKVVVIVVCFFVCSIVNSAAQSWAKREQREKSLEDRTE